MLKLNFNITVAVWISMGLPREELSLRAEYGLNVNSVFSFCNEIVLLFKSTANMESTFFFFFGNKIIWIFLEMI